MSQLTPKQKLVPLSVPWMVSPSTSYLRLSAFESAGEGPTRVSFVATFPRRATTRDTVPFGEAVLVANPVTMQPDGSNLEGETQLITLTFDGANYARMCPTSDERDDKEFESFDSTSLWQFDNEKGDWGIAEFHELWRKTGLCPSPGFYEVKNSQWLRAMRVNDPAYKHYRIEGHDSNVEVIATNYVWQSEGTLEGW